MASENHLPHFKLTYLLAGILWIGLCAPTLPGLFEQWEIREEYSHAYFLPLISSYFIWQRRHILLQQELTPSLAGVGLNIIAVSLFVLGLGSNLPILEHYALLLLLFSWVWATFGWQVLKLILPPLALVFFAIPLPDYLDILLSSKLQLISSSLGVHFIHWCRIPVFQDGNIIDLGVYKLQVVEACSGLRYLFPLLSIGYICAYLFQGPRWQRALIFLSCIPITVLMNSFRIGIVGILVNQWGETAAEGILHDLEGWVVYMLCFGLLVLEMWLLSFLQRPYQGLLAIFGLPDATPESSEWQYKQGKPRQLGASAWSVLVMLLLLNIFSVLRGQREEIIPPHQALTTFPTQITSWQGQRKTLTERELSVLKLTDYSMIDYHQDNGSKLNFYVAYYESQKYRAAPHSPKVCIPGGGWEIAGISRIQLDDYPVNRLIIKKGLERQLVYYWYQQRSRFIANEFLMKWYLFQDALLLNRTDGALVRISAEIPPELDEQRVDQELQRFFHAQLPILNSYLPH